MWLGRGVTIAVCCGVVSACMSADETMRLTRFTPSSWSVDELPLVATITGQGLGDQVSLSVESDEPATLTPIEVSLGGVPLRVVGRASDTELQVAVPAIFDPGVYDAELSRGHRRAVLPGALTLTVGSVPSSGGETSVLATSSAPPSCTGEDCEDCTLGDWSEPELVSELTSDGDLWSPSISSDGLTLYFAEGIDGVETIFEAKRADRDSPFVDVKQVTGAFGQESNGTPVVSSDGLTLYFHSSVAGGDRNLWRVTRARVDAEFANATALTALSSPQEDHVPWVSADDLKLLFASQRPGLGSSDLWVATRTDRSQEFAELRLLGGVNGPQWDSRPVLTADGNWLYFCSTRAGGRGEVDIWRANRAAGDDEFNQVANVSTLNSVSDDMDLTLSRDDRELLFVSNRTAPQQRPGQMRVWRSVRRCL